MINLPVDAAYALDFLAILEIKLEKSSAADSYHAQKKCNFYFNNLGEQIGDEKLKEIVTSALYTELKRTNFIIFETIDTCKKMKISAQTVDKLNYRRWELKNEIQKKYFGSGTSEIKLGY